MCPLSAGVFVLAGYVAWHRCISEMGPTEQQPVPDLAIHSRHDPHLGPLLQ